MSREAFPKSPAAPLTVAPSQDLSSQLSQLLFHAAEPYLVLLQPPSVWLTLIETGLHRRESEFHWRRLRVATSVKNQVVGVALTVPGDELQAARAADLGLLLTSLDRTARLDLMTALRNAKDALPEPPEESLYLSKLSVSEAAHGQGFGRRLLGDCLKMSKDESRPLSLLVEESNSPAIRLYLSMGLVVVERGPRVLGLRHLLMESR